MSLSWFRQLIRRAVARVESRTAEERHGEAAKQTRAFLEPERDGMAVLGIRIGALDGLAAMRALNERADAIGFPGDR